MLEGLSHILQKISDGVVTIASWLLAFFMGGMVISILLAIISRFIIKIPLPWTEELSRYLMIWTAFVAGSLGLKSGVHVGVKVLVQMAPEMIARWIGFITNLVLLFSFLSWLLRVFT